MMALIIMNMKGKVMQKMKIMNKIIIKMLLYHRTQIRSGKGMRIKQSLPRLKEYLIKMRLKIKEGYKETLTLTIL